MKLGIMQPYFLPYIGYWQLIHAVDTFILFDDVQFQRRAWINRNRILKHGGHWQYITIPVQKHSRDDLIKNIYTQNDMDWKEQILRQLAHYGYKNCRAPFFSETENILKETFSRISSRKISHIITELIKEICNRLEINTEILLSSQQSFDYSNVHDAGDWALSIAEQMNSTQYINPIGGAELFDQEQFILKNIQLSFIKSNEIRYKQCGPFVPSLSIVDVLMFNGIDLTKNLLIEYSIVNGK